MLKEKIHRDERGERGGGRSTGMRRVREKESRAGNFVPINVNP